MSMAKDNGIIVYDDGENEVSEEEYLKNLEEEVRYLRRQVAQLNEARISLMRELEYYKREVEKLLAPPLIEAVLLELLPDNRAVVKSTTGPNLIVNISGSIELSALKPGTKVALNQRGSAIVEVLPERNDPYVQAMEIIERPNYRYSDIGGLADQIRQVKEVIELPLKKPEIFKEIGIDPPKGVLLYGPPGTGKTLLAKAVAGESNATFIRVVATEFVQKFIGEGARIVREVFALARKKAPAIIFIDEIDAIGAKRVDIGTSGEREVQRTLMQLLAEMDGFDDLYNVRIIAATNRVDILDPALLRPGRFDRLIEVPPPDLKGRIEIFKVHTRNVKLAQDVDFEILARLTEGATGAEIKSIVVEAGYQAIRRGDTAITMSDFQEAIQTVLKDKPLRPIASQKKSSSQMLVF